MKRKEGINSNPRHLKKRLASKLLIPVFGLAISTAQAAGVHDDSYYLERARHIVSKQPDDNIPDGEYVFISLSVPEKSWKRYLSEAEGRESFRGLVMRGISDEQLEQYKNLVIEARKAGKEIPKPVWGNHPPLMKPKWFRQLDIGEVPAYVVKQGNEVCIAYGDTTMDMARQILRQKGCAFLSNEDRK